MKLHFHAPFFVGVDFLSRRADHHRCLAAPYAGLHGGARRVVAQRHRETGKGIAVVALDGLVAGVKVAFHRGMGHGAEHIGPIGVGVPGNRKTIAWNQAVHVALAADRKLREFHFLHAGLG